MEIKKIKPFTQMEIVTEIVSLYQETFGSSPWNEGYKCPVCGLIASLSYQSKICPACLEQDRRILMIEYWPKSKIISDFYSEMRKPKALCLVAQEKNKLIGFAWGYEVMLNQEFAIYLEAFSIHEILSGKFFYLDEVAVGPRYQGHGVGKKIIKQIFAEQTQPKILLRTLDNSQMFNLIKHLGGEIILNISRERVIMALPP